MNFKSLFCVLSLTLVTFMSNGQCLSDNFDTGYGNWGGGSGTYQNTTAGVTSNGTGFNSTGDDIITNSVVTNPNVMTFWLARASNTSNKTISIQYSTSNTGPWTTARDIVVSEVTTIHQEFTVNLNLTGDYYLRIAMTQRSGGSYYLDDIEVTCGASGCSLDSSGLSSITCNDNATSSDNTDDYITFDLNPTGSGIGSNYTVTVSSGTISPSASVTYGSSTSFTLQNGSAGAGDVTITVTDDTDGTCSLIETITDPGSCSLGPTTNCLSEDFVTFSDWTNNGTSIDNVASHYGVAAPCRALGNGDNLISPTVNNPTSLSFYQDASNGGNGSTATIDYRIGTGAWTSLYSFTVTTAGNTETVDLTNIGSVDLSAQTDVTFRFNSGFNTWYLDDVEVTCGTSGCTPTHTITSFSPTSGPENTEITITGTGFTSGTTVAFTDSVSATIISQTATEIVVQVPSGASTGSLTVTEASCPVDSPTEFTFISGGGGNCGSNSPTSFNGLLFSGIYDDAVSSCHYFELLNSTSSDIDLSSYTIGVDNNFTLGSTPPVTGFDANLALSGTLAAGETYMVQLSSSGACTACSTIVPDINFTSGGINDEDRLVLYTGTTVIDVWQNHSNGAGYNEGYVFSRDFSSTAPSVTFDNNDWNSSPTADCFGFSIAIFNEPIITSQTNNSTCTTIEFEIAATAGESGALSYQWYYNDGVSLTWTVVNTTNLPGFTINGETTNQLYITSAANSIANLDNYQFYCEITEVGTCNIGSSAMKVDSDSFITTTWNGTTWDNGTPTSSMFVVISGNYTTNTTTPSFDACSLIIDNGVTLDITAGNYVNIVNNLTVNGTLEIRHEGSLVQQNDLGTVDGTGTTNVHKTTPTYTEYDYTYWSSPVQNETVENVLAANPSNYIFYAVTHTFNDSDNDSFDDEGDDWVVASGNLTPGIGLIAMGEGSFTTPLSSLPYPTYTQSVIFSDNVNNGEITIDVSEDNDLTDSSLNQNLLGNPYPSAIDPVAFINANSGLEGTLYFWSHRTFISNSQPGPDAYNFTNADYDSYNLAGGVASGAGGQVSSSFKIASGQGFFANVTDASVDVVFNNAMRLTTENNYFYRNQTTEQDRIWINLTTPNNVFRQVLIAFFDNTTPGYDRAYDGKRLEVGNDYDFYSLIEEEKYAIQSRETFDSLITIPLGLKVTQPDTLTISIANLEGVLSTSEVYLEDKDLNIIHDLKNSDYTFNLSSPGNYNDRFKLRFNNSVLSVDDEITPKENLIIFQEDKDFISIKTSKNKVIKNIEIYDLLGRTLANKKTNSSIVSIPSTNYNSGRVLIVKVLLENKTQLITKYIKK